MIGCPGVWLPIGGAALVNGEDHVDCTTVSIAVDKMRVTSQEKISISHL